MQVVRPALGLHNTISSLRLRAVEALGSVAPPLKKAGPVHGPGPRSLIKSDRGVTFRDSRSGLRRPISLELALMTHGQPAVVAVPLRGTLAGIWCHTSPTILALLFAYWSSTIFARPLGRTSTGIGPRAVAAVAARRRTHRRRAVRVEPAVPVWIKVQVVLQFEVCWGLGEVLLSLC